MGKTQVVNLKSFLRYKCPEFFFLKIQFSNFFNNGPNILKFIVRVRIYHIFKKKNSFENWIFLKNFFSEYLQKSNGLYI